MSNLINNIKRLAGLVKNETRSGANTAARIGGLFEEIGAELEQKYDRSESDQIMTTHNTADASHQNIQDKIESKITGVNDQLSQEIDLLSKNLSDSIEQKYATLSGALDQTNNDLSGHSGDQTIHKTSQQIRSEITDADIPATLARITDVDTKDASTLTTARQYTTEKVAEIINNAPANLNTLSELAAAIDNNPDFNISISTRLSGKADKNHSHRPEDIATNAENRFMTDAEKNLWNSKAAGDHHHDSIYLKTNGDGQNLTTTFTQASTRTDIASGEKLTSIFGKISRWFSDLKTVAFTASAADITEHTNRRFMTDDERTKLIDIEDKANKYIHPATHPATMITEGEGRLFLKVIQGGFLSKENMRALGVGIYFLNNVDLDFKTSAHGILEIHINPDGGGFIAFRESFIYTVNQPLLMGISWAPNGEFDAWETVTGKLL